MYDHVHGEISQTPEPNKHCTWVLYVTNTGTNWFLATARANLDSSQFEPEIFLRSMTRVVVEQN